MAPQITAIHHRLVRLIQKSVEVPDTGKAQFVDDEPRVVALQCLQGIPIVSINDECAPVELFVVLIQPGQDFTQSHTLSGVVNPLQIHVSHQLVLQLRSVLHSSLGVVLRNELLLVLEFDPGFLAPE